jgi:hypothetical protein
LKPEYEKPTAVPLGEAAKGSGQCNEGSGVMPGATGYCLNGDSASYRCSTGGSASNECTNGTDSIVACGAGQWTGI